MCRTQILSLQCLKPNRTDLHTVPSQMQLYDASFNDGLKLLETPFTEAKLSDCHVLATTSGIDDAFSKPPTCSRDDRGRCPVKRDHENMMENGHAC